MVTSVECQFPSLHIQLSDGYIFLNTFFSVIDLASDEEYCVPYIFALTNGVQCLAQVVMKLRENSNLILGHATEKKYADQHKHNQT